MGNVERELKTVRQDEVCATPEAEELRKLLNQVVDRNHNQVYLQSLLTKALCLEKAITKIK